MLRLSSDGNRLDGENQMKNKVWAVRARLWDYADCRRLEGTNQQNQRVWAER